MKNEVINCHVRKLPPDSLYARIGLLIHLRVDVVHCFVLIQAVARGAPDVSSPVESVDVKAGVLEKGRLPV